MKQLKIQKAFTRRETQALDKYFNDISKIDLIKPEREVELAERIQKGDEEALNELVQANLRFVVSVAKQYMNQGLSLSDLINEGNVGLMKAARRFDPSRGFRFISYAVWWIRQSILRAIVEYSRMVRLPANKMSLFSKIKSARIEFIQEFERAPSTAELAELLEVTPKQIEKVLEDGEKHLSLDAPLGNDDDGGTMLDFYTDEQMDSPDLLLMEESLKREVENNLSSLSPREVNILSLLYGLGDNKTYSLEEVGDRMGLTRERVRQLRERALRRLRHRLRKNAGSTKF
ncbi:MAG: sigma-70 family RNA polymerase sigma factor [Bacteroidetes bacterium]|jgi:RNA polymerase primary sigma factor|nr:sigma-70 family RNA polymerase sigma factor [Bacteroidota bacterium]